MKYASIDIDAVIAEVAAAVGLAEGPAGVRDVLRAIARSRAGSRPRGGPARRAAGADRRRRLQRAAQARDGGPGPAGAADPRAGRRPARRRAAAELDGQCPDCGGTRDRRSPARLASAGRPSWSRPRRGSPRPNRNSTRPTARSTPRSAGCCAMHEAGALAGQRIIVLGDDDLISVAIAAGSPRCPAAERLAAADRGGLRPRCAGAASARRPPAPGPGRADRARPAPAAARRPGRRVRRGLHRPALHRGRGGAVPVPGGRRRWPRRPGRGTCSSRSAPAGPEETLRTQQLIAGMGLAVRGLAPGFNAYTGAGILAGTSHLYHLRTTGRPRRRRSPGATPGPLYTADSPGRSHPAVPVRRLRGRARGRPRRAAGPGSPALQAAGLPGLRGHGVPPDAAAGRGEPRRARPGGRGLR